ncbi:MAG: hypothetical protein IJ374_05650 [Lachnospiraceae bacterium]|nr:hypothetical protein [Lachnospiraceae bacterium]
MKHLNDQLRELREQVAEKAHLESVRRSLYDQQRELERKVRELNQLRSSENADVEKLEGFSLAALYYLVTGKKEEMLDKERQEAYAAQVKYEAAQAELDAVAEEIRKTRERLTGLSDCEQKYANLKQEKKEKIKQSMGPEAEQIMELEEAIAVQESRLKEIREASGVGSEALQIANQIIASLDKAKGWGTWDAIGGGGIVTEVAKRNHLNTAQRMVGDLQVKLRKYRTELTDVTVEANVEVGIDGFLNFADYFFDGLLVDWTVLNKITKSKSQAESTRNKISMMQYRLSEIKRSAEQARDEKKAELDALILKIGE